MMKTINPEKKPTIPNEDDQCNASVKKTSEILKRTNELIRQGELDRAQGELLSANREVKEHFEKEPAASSFKALITSAQAQLSPPPLKLIISSSEQNADIQSWSTASSSEIPFVKSSE